MKILIAEDDRVSALVLRKSLESMGHEVLATNNGEEAWEKLADPTIRLVVTDWMMPKLDGLELCRRVRARQGWPYVYFMLLSAKEYKDDRHEAIALGADDFLVKPLDRAELHSRLSVAFRILAMEEELRSRAAELEIARAELTLRNLALEEMATTDPLTGLKNRRYFIEQLESCFSFAQRQSMPISVMMIDVDHFKAYNDTFGHAAGDEILREFGSLLVRNVRDHDVVARFGGEEFILLLPATDPHTSAGAARRLLDSIRATPWPRRGITASIGVATIHHGMIRPLELVEMADQALYEAKTQGRARVVHYRSIIPDLAATAV